MSEFLQRKLEAIYADGVFRPLAPLNFLDENQPVTLIISRPREKGPLAGWAGGLSDADAKEMLRVIEAGFEQVNPDDWK